MSRRGAAWVLVAAASACSAYGGTGVDEPEPADPSQDAGADAAVDPGAAEAGVDSGPVAACSASSALDAACPAEAPYCVAGACRACADLPEGCAAVDPRTPVCRPGAAKCSACTEHAECASGACRIATGECFGETNRLWVSASASCTGATGTEQAPFCTVDAALAAVHAQPGDEPWVVFVAGHPDAYTLGEDAYLPSNRTFALIGPASGLTARLTATDSRYLHIHGSRDQYVARFKFEGEYEGSLLYCGKGDVWVDDVELSGGSQGAYVQCDLRMRRAKIHGASGWAAEVGESGRLTIDEGLIESNSGAITMKGEVVLRRTSIGWSYNAGGITVEAGTLSLTNCSMHANVYAIGHIDVGPNAVAILNYVVALADGLSCSPSGGLVIRNSIVDNVTCDSAQIHRSLVPEDLVSRGTGNLAAPPGYTQLFVDSPAGDYHIRPEAPDYLLGVAQRSASDPAVDLDGDPRPGIGEPDYPGIDAPR